MTETQNKVFKLKRYRLEITYPIKPNGVEITTSFEPIEYDNLQEISDYLNISYFQAQNILEKKKNKMTSECMFCPKIEILRINRKY